MSLPLYVPGWFAMVLAFALILWACSTLPFRLGLQRLMKDPTKGLLLLLPGLIGVVLIYFITADRFGWHDKAWLRDRLVIGVLVGGIAALIQLGGLGVLLARQHGRSLGTGLLAAVAPIVLLTVSVPLAEEVLSWVLHKLLDWTGFMGWFIWLVERLFVLGEFVIGWFAVKWALNLFTRQVMGLAQADAVYEVDAQFTADSLGWTIWPFAITLGLIVPVPALFEVADGIRMPALDAVKFALNWPNLLAPQHCNWSWALPWTGRAFFEFFWHLVFMFVQATMLIGYIEAYVRHRGTSTTPAAAHA